MTRAELEKHLDNEVMIELYDGWVVRVKLIKTGDERFKEYPELYLRRNYYCVCWVEYNLLHFSVLFRVSHIKKLEVLD